MKQHIFDVFDGENKIGALVTNDRNAIQALRTFAKNNGLMCSSFITAKRMYINAGGYITTVTINL